jgi:predicted metalloendopeptidase
MSQIYITGGAAPLVPSVDASINPSQDFYSYVNNRWQKHIHLPPYQGSLGVSEEIETEVRNSLLKTITGQIKTNPADAISKLATSFLHTASQKNSIVDLQRILNTFDCIGGPDDIARSIGSLNRIQAHAPLSLVIANDSYKNSQCCIYLYEPTIGLPEKHYYLPGSRNHIILKYSKLLKTVGKLMNIEMLESAISVESAIIPYLSEGEDLSNLEYSYNRYSYNKLVKDYKDIPWSHLFESWGAKEHVYKKAVFIVTNMKYISALNRMFKTMGLETWKIWMRAMTILSFIEFLPPPYDDLHFELYGKALRGNSEKLPQKYLMLRVLQTFTPQDLGRMFVKMEVKNGTKARATLMVKQLKLATINRLRALEWMDKSTKTRAIHKVESMLFQVAFPNKWESETKDLEILHDRPLLNILSLSTQDTFNMIKDLHKNQCKKSEDTWSDGSFEVNAYYYPEGNMMVVPAGILRPPFFDLSRSNAWNLGGIGAAIGHEITHGFDEDGRFYDSNGNYKNWWTANDSITFTKLTKSLIDLFDGKDYMGGKVNGKLTLSENLADLGGIAIALQALSELLPKDPIKIKEAYKEFFTSYAVSWRNKDRAKKAKQSLLLDRHAPAPLRVNLIVKQFEEFYTAFDIKPEDPGYIPPEERIKLW